MSEQTEGSSPRAEDPLLVVLVELVNRHEKRSLSATLTVGGSVVSGMMIGVTEYYDRLADAWQEMIPGGEEVAKVYRSLSADASEKINNDDLRPDEPSFVHMKDAQYLSPTGLVPTAPMLLWRGRIANVDGFSLGRLSVGSVGH